MISLLIPWVFGVAMAGALAAIALHLLSVRRPNELLLPTARFLPDRVVRAVSRTKRPSDVLLLLLRIATVLAIGLAAAQPIWRAINPARVVLVVADRGVVRDTNAMRALVLQGVDTTTGVRVVFPVLGDGVPSEREPGGLIPAAWRAAAGVADEGALADSFDLHVLLSRARLTNDDGFLAWRDAWPGRVVTHVPTTAVTGRRVVLVPLDSVGVRATDDDPVRIAFTWHAGRQSTSPGGDALRVDSVGVARSDDARAASGATIGPAVRVFWPTNGVPSGWRALDAADTASALVAAGRALMGSWLVRAVVDSSRMTTPIAWWSDGRIAATESGTSTGCERQVAAGPIGAGDALLTSDARAVFEALMAPCAARALVQVSALDARAVSGTGLASASAFRAMRASGATGWITPLLWALGLLLLFIEGRVRARTVSVNA